MEEEDRGDQGSTTGCGAIVVVVVVVVVVVEEEDIEDQGPMARDGLNATFSIHLFFGRPKDLFPSGR